MEKMSGYSAAAGGGSEVYGSVTRVVISSSASTLESGHRASTWRTASSKQKQEYLTLPPRSQHVDGQKPPNGPRLPPRSENRPTATRKDLAVTTDELQTWKLQQRPPTGRRPEQVDERQRAWLASSSVIKHVSSAGRQLHNLVITMRYDKNILSARKNCMPKALVWTRLKAFMPITYCIAWNQKEN